MTKAELLQPRFKVIADYPSCPFIVGEIIDWTETTETQKRAGIIRSKSGYGMKIDIAEKYPHLFKKLEWWEERSKDDMPKYIKYADNVFGWKILKVDGYALNDFKEHYALTADSISGKIFLWNASALPSTEEEYKDFQNQIKSI